jgi:hypothetical protein
MISVPVSNKLTLFFLLFFLLLLLSELDLKENMVRKYEQEVNRLVDSVEEAKKIADEEISRRRDVERRAVQASEMQETRARQVAAAAKKKHDDKEKARVDALNKLDAEYAAAEEEAEVRAK